LLAGELVEGDTVPIADQADRPVALFTNSLGTVTSPPEIRMPWGENSE
jgi:hypothetical protein